MSLEEAITKLTAEVTMLRNVILDKRNAEKAAAPTAPANKPGPKPKPAPVEPDPSTDGLPADQDGAAELPADPEEDDGSEAKRAEVRAILKNIIGKKGRPLGMAYLKKYGAEDVQSIPADKLDAAIKYGKTVAP